MKQNKLIFNEDGMSLIEVIASLVILTIILISFVNIFPQMGFTNIQNEDKQSATAIAQQELLFWKKTLENSSDFDTFKLTPGTTYSFIDSDCNVTYDSDKITIKVNKTKSILSDFKVELIISRNSDLNSNPEKAYQIHIKLLKTSDILVSETYGYIFYEG